MIIINIKKSITKCIIEYYFTLSINRDICTLLVCKRKYGPVMLIKLLYFKFMLIGSNYNK